MLKKCVFFIMLGMTIQMAGQDTAEVETGTTSRVKLDGVAAVVGKNIVLDSEIAAFKLSIEQESEGKVTVSDCEMIEQIMHRKLLAHHAVVDSLEVTEAEVQGIVNQKIAYFLSELGSEENLYRYYGFDDMDELRTEFINVEKESRLIQKMRQNITKDVSVTPEEIRNYFNSLKEQNNLPEIGAEVEIGQIVINAKSSEEENQRVIDKLNELKKEIQNGSSFKMKAYLNSDDPAVSGNRDGQGGKYTITRESGFDTDFKEQAFSLEEGEISKPFKTLFGYHILRVDKIRGKQREVSHILIQPEITEEELRRDRDTLTMIKNKVLSGEMTFEEAVKKYSEDKETKATYGLLMNGETNDSKFELTRMDPTLYARISSLKVGEFTEPFYDETVQGLKMNKILYIKSRTESHIADLGKDYVKIQNLALQKKQNEAIAKWVKEKIPETYIKLNNQYKDCDYENNWLKN
ncbi:peptidylprolyl isomerase [Flavobacteriaceae bacterium F08102]|nr:peptidylprolyl isomerase [Flavobacteriaceae bacterium F08102]